MDQELQPPIALLKYQHLIIFILIISHHLFDTLLLHRAQRIFFPIYVYNITDNQMQQANPGNLSCTLNDQDFVHVCNQLLPNLIFNLTIYCNKPKREIHHKEMCVHVLNFTPLRQSNFDYL